MDLFVGYDFSVEGGLERGEEGEGLREGVWWRGGRGRRGRGRGRDDGEDEFSSFSVGLMMIDLEVFLPCSYSVSSRS